MTIHAITGCPTPELAERLDRFERQFTYPLGPDRRFRISHGSDYARFFRAMGPAACLVAEQNLQVLGTLGMAVCPLRLPAGQTLQAAYFGDLKIDSSARGGFVLYRLAAAARQWLAERVVAAFGVVMSGTSVLPEDYTGRLSIPSFSELSRCIVLHLQARTGPPPEDGTVRFVGEGAGRRCWEQLTMHCITTDGGRPAERSEMSAEWLATWDGSACGRLEDTRRAKRLYTDDEEILSLHMAAFAYRTPSAGVELLRVACSRAGALGYARLFTAINSQDSTPFIEQLSDLLVVAAPASIYGAGLPAGGQWNINSSEI